MGDFVFTLLSKKKRYSPINESVYMMLYGRRKNKVYMKRFSIIIPVYNVAPYLRECLDSVLAQTFTDWEAICVDDGSTDESGAILDEYAAKDKRFRVFHQPNAGVSVARNVALKVVDGNWVLFLDSDDLLRGCALDDIFSNAEENSSMDFIVYDDVKFEEHGLPQYMDEDKVSPVIEDLSQDVVSRFASVCVGGAAYSKSVLDGVFFKEYVLGEDLVFFCEILSKAKRVLFLNKAEYANRLRIGSATRSKETHRKLLDRVLFHEAMFVFIQNSGKNFGSLFVHGRGNSWIETVPSMILNWKNKAEREELFQQWCNSMRKAASMVFFSGWQRFVAKVVSITRSKLLVRLLCVLPYKLKCRGFHR